MSDIKVSIVVPIYNLEDYVPRCMEALCNQTLKEIEIICVNDGSTDSAPQIIEGFREKYPDKVKIFHKENGGEASARTYGLKRATGEYVGFIDSDDVPEVTWAEKLYNAAKDNDADIAFSGYDRVMLDTGKTVAVEMTQYGTQTREVKWDEDLYVRRVTLTACDVVNEDDYKNILTFEQMDMFIDYNELAKKRQKDVIV